MGESIHNMYARCGVLIKAQTVFDELQHMQNMPNSCGIQHWEVRQVPAAEQWVQRQPCTAAPCGDVLQRLRSLAQQLCNHLERLIPPSPSYTSPSLIPFQKGNFTPVSHDCPPQACSLDENYGPLPAFLQGTYIRNGPNQQFAQSGGDNSHPFDGDGMLHAVTFRAGGPPCYCSRYVHTTRFLQERAAQQALFTKTFSALTSPAPFVATAHICLALLRHILGLVDLTKGMGLANTGVVFHHGKLLALAEDDLPYALDLQPDGDLLNRGRYSFKGSQKMRTMTSHPKVDLQTGEMVFCSYNPFHRPYLTFFWVSMDGMLSKRVPIYLIEPCMIHDFAITPNYIIFAETQLVFHPFDVVLGKAPIKHDATRTQRFGVLERNARDDSCMHWFEVPGCNCFHIINAWEEKSRRFREGDKEEIVLMCPTMSRPEDLMNGNLSELQSSLTEVRLDMRHGKATQRPLFTDSYTNFNVEMGTMNKNFQGVKNRFVYMGVIGSSCHSFKGVIKLDSQSRQVVASRMFDKNYFASEPLFVPKASFEAYRELKVAHEDEGCLLCLLHHDDDHATVVADDNDDDHIPCQMLVLDTQSPTLEILASIKLPRRVPYGFHGLFVSHIAN
ncbi:hypothetical protein L7F22_059789 [Adiantum nelumboides]|nr:hypothetical protein [Adiantum nelumboides]